MLNLRAIRGQDKGFCEFLNWFMPIDDGVVLNKDGSLLAGFFFRGRDLASSTIEELIQVRDQVSNAMMRLHGGWSAWIDLNKVEAADYPARHLSSFPDPISQMVDDERRAQFEAAGQHFDTECTLVIQYTPPLRRKAWLVDLMYDDDSTAATSPASAILAYFKKQLRDIEDVLSNPVSVRRMRRLAYLDHLHRRHERDELVDYLNTSATFETIGLEIKPRNYLDMTIGGCEVEFGSVVRMGERYIAVLQINGFPELGNPCILSMIDTLPFPLRWSSRWIALDTTEADKQLKKIEKKWKRKIRGFIAETFKLEGMIDEDAVQMERQASTARAKTNSGTVGTGYYTPILLIPGRSHVEAMERASQARQALASINFGAEVETINTPQAFLGSLSGHSHYNVRLLPQHTDTLADLLPLSGVWTGEQTAPCPYYPPGAPALAYATTMGGKPFWLNLHVDDVGHTLLFGPTGSGKTTLLSFLIMQALRYQGMRVWCFDYKRGQMATVMACGGKHFDVVDRQNRLQFAPLSLMQDRTDLLRAMDWIATCFQLQTQRPPTDREKEAIFEALALLLSGPDRSLTHFVHLCQNEAVSSALNHYALEGPLGYITDAEEDGIGYTDLMAFEIEDLMQMPPEAKIPVLLYLFWRLESRLDGKPTLLVLDEAWLALGNPVFAPKLREWLKVLRSKNCAVILATQSLSDAVESGLLDVLIEACPRKIFAANPGANGESTREFYRKFDFNDAMIQIVAGAIPKRHYYVTTPRDRGLIDLTLGPIALSFAGVTDNASLTRIRDLERQHGQEWPMHWLREREAPDVALAV